VEGSGERREQVDGEKTLSNEDGPRDRKPKSRRPQESQGVRKKSKRPHQMKVHKGRSIQQAQVLIVG